ncbi:hypothetical protein [Micromonospora rifamycinica]|uniref:DUF8175 domain-containing protein n=1 Tax=Micromonospora rifamycinica TaxID=291594 RepID=A0A1C5GXV5_9ACTN|nr:hypothetical protein [Micromonospora rifamycinica]SCG38437.1 hypothetical protein GA0070623_0439 [Micromonospora rifamycinica]
MIGGRGRSPADPPFWTERGWLLSVAFLAGMALLAAVAWVSSGGTGQTPVDPVGRTTAEQVAQCPPRPVVAAGPAVPPDDVTWRTLDGGDRVPVSATQGPSRTADGVLGCFAHTPIGAVLAAHAVPTQLGGPAWRAVTDRQVLPGPARDVLVARLEAAAGVVTSRGGGSYAGFALARYAADTARVQLLVKTGAGGYVATLVELRWDAGDWKLVPSRAGVVHASIGTVTGSAGYTLWRK